MPPDCYKIEVIHYLTPHLIWIEVRDPSVLKDEFLFEQIGVYGILPLEKTLDIETEDVKSRKCEEWLPAAASVMKDVLKNNAEIWFSPTHIDKRSSIFDDNIHKYGELLIKTGTGKLKKLSNLLVKSGLAYFDVCEFHEKLSCGKLKTKLKTIETQEVIKELENFYIRNDRPKNSWKKSVEKQTSVFQMSQNFESSLTVSNVEKHNNQMINKTIQNKFRDFELCKDIDEKSVGRAFRKTKIDSDDESNSLLLKKKLSIAKVKSSKTKDLSDTYKNIRIFLDANSNIKETSKDHNNELINTNSNTVCSEIDLKKEKENYLSKKLKYHNKLLKVAKKNDDLESNYGDSSVENNIEVNIISENSKIDKSRHTKEEQTMINETDGIQDFNLQTSKACARSQKRRMDHVTDVKVAYGPPGLNPQKFKIECMTLQDYKVNDKQICLEDQVELKKSDCMFAEVDSEAGIEITNKKTLKDQFKTLNVVSSKNEKKIGNRDNNCIISVDNNSREEINHSDDSIDKKKSSPSSLLLKKKLKAQEKLSIYDNCRFSSSDTSNKDSSSDMTPLKKSFDDDDIDDVIESLEIKYRDDVKIKEKEKVPKDTVTAAKVKNYVNPFKNIDPNISVFVDKLVSPILMVHCKIDRRIQPIFEMRDVYFSKYIHNILKNMSIERPMMLQTVSWLTILRGYSLFMISPLGSGKTLGYLPAVCRLVSDTCEINDESVGPVCIIVCATAKSVANVEKMTKMFLNSEERVLACYAGVDNLDITARLLNGCDVLVSTPSSLVRLLQLSEFGVDLRRLSTFVLDDCERLSDVYGNEIKLFLYKIKEMLKSRVNKELKVQYVLASRIWCSFMEPLARKAPDTVICIGAFQECVLYSRTNASVSLVKSENKLDAVMEFLKEIDASKKTIIVCHSDDEVRLLENALKRSKHIIFLCDNTMTIHDLYNLSVSWADYEEPLIGPILICCDDSLIHMNITDAHNLIHFSLPPLFSMFCKRFAVVNDNYPSIFKSDSECVKIKVLLEENNVEQLPKILNYIKRCTDNVPSFLDEICSNILKEKDQVKATKFYPICDNLLMLGYCPDIYNCQERHTIIKDYDTPKDWLPKEGVITCKILYYHSATLFSVRLLSCTVNGKTINYPQTYSVLCLKMGMYYSKESNRKLHGIPEVGDICATSVKLNFYVRCQVLKILTRYEKGNPNKILVKLIDEEKFEITRDIYLYHLPDDLKEIESRAVQIRLANIEPKDKDITFSDLARDSLKNIVETDTELFVRGNVSLTLGNCIFVNTLEACQDLTSLNEVVVKYNLKQELLEHHAIPNPEHLSKLEKLCIKSGLHMKHETKLPDADMPIKNIQKGTWAHLDSDGLSCVFFASAISPDKFFVRLDKFESCMSSLLQDIKKYVNSNPSDCGNIKEGEIILAKFPDDSTYERARVDGINEDKAKCFFVDQGDWRDVPLNQMLPITDQLINQLPFQAIECRLIGVKPAGDQWTDFSTYWFTDNCYDDKGDLKYLFVKYFTKESAEFTNGHKYSVAVIDTSTDQDIIINNLMIDLNLAQENENEIKYLDNFEINIKPDQQKLLSENEDDDWEAISATSSFMHTNKDQEQHNKVETQTVSSENILFQPPIRSVPLVNSDDSDDTDKWDVHINDDFMEFLPALKVLKDLKERDTIKENTTARSAESCNKKEDKRNVKQAEKIELDSDDLTSPDNTFVSQILPEKSILKNIDQNRRPKLVWRQNKSSVTVKIQLIGVENYKLDIEERVLNFNANVNDTDYAFDLELYGVVNKEKSTHVNKGQYILVKLIKVLSKNWLTLTKDGGIKKWIVYDVDNLDTSSEEETVDDSSIKNIVRNIHNNNESESDDDEFFDDI